MAFDQREHLFKQKKPIKVVDKLADVEELIDEDLSTTQEISSDDAADVLYDEIELMLREEVQTWLSEYGPKLFSLGQDRWLTKQQKKEKSLKTSQKDTTQPAKKRRIL